MHVGFIKNSFACASVCRGQWERASGKKGQAKGKGKTGKAGKSVVAKSYQSDPSETPALPIFFPFRRCHKLAQWLA